ncbi:hypothetical protein BROUX41_000967 [Berkeleyomyces rouxiae]
MPHPTPRFFAAPLVFMRWAIRERPAYFWSVAIGASCPVFIVAVPPLRHAVGDVNAAKIPVTYPIPTGPRKQLTGFDDE